MSSGTGIIIETCAETTGECIDAEIKGADRLELCSRLDLDGLTPDFALVQDVLSNVSIPVKVMIRCRAGNFFYSDEEMQIMFRDVRQLKDTGISGFVFGALLDSGGKIHPDMEKIRMIVHEAFPLPVTLHKCIDLCSNILSETEKVCRSGLIQSILSSGTMSTAKEGMPILIKMQEICHNFGVELIAAGKITRENLPELLSECTLTSFHGRKIV